MSDGQLLGRFTDHRDEWAFAALVGRHGSMVLQVCRQVLGDQHGAEDAFQATFLVLARKSGSIRRPELLGNWLYGVALRTSWEAKMRDGRRRRRETLASAHVARGSTVDAARPESSMITREEFQVLHEEVSRLPERYRAAVVLCELEGLSYREAATRLDCPVGTIGARLVRARERLRSRMIRRGIVPAVAATHAMFGAEGASTLIPSSLADSTVRAALGFATGDVAASSLVSSTVAGLTEAVLKGMAVARLKAFSGVVLVVGMSASLGLVGNHRPAPTRPPAGREVASSVPQASTPEAPKAIEATDRPAAEKPVVVEDRQEVEPEVVLAMARPDRPDRDERARGEALFFKEWTPNTRGGRGGDGLGPVFNETSCVACHGLGAPGGAGPDSKNVMILTSTSANGLEKVHPGFRGTRSVVLHRFGTDPAYGSWRRQFLESNREKPQGPPKEQAEETVESRIRKALEQAAVDRRNRDRPTRLHPTQGVSLTVSERNTPALFGAGRIDAIPPEVLIEQAKGQPAEVRGRVGRDREGQVGRFGWKAQIASLHEFVRGACASELGLEVPGHSQAISPTSPLEKPKGLDLEQGECDDLVAYVRALPAPVAVDPYGPHGTREMGEGRRLFAEVGCATCHAPSIGEVRGIYSDLLLHDLGQSLGDSGSSYGIEGPETPGGPSPGEWRTPPLWGFRDSGPYLHDGRAQTLEEAIALHGGQGTKSARDYFALSPEDRSSIEAFLKSLVAPVSATAPGVMLAADLEARIEPDEVRQAEALVRRQREEAEALEKEKRAQAQRRQALAQAVKRSEGLFRMAVNLEKSGKRKGAIELYRQVARDAPETDQGRSAVQRIARLVGSAISP